MGKGGGDKPPPPDYERMQREAIAAGDRQTQNNRPGIRGPFASTSWTTGPDGRPVMNNTLNPALSSASSNLQREVMRTSNSPMDWSQFGTLGTGDDAMRKGTDAAYNEATRRLGDRFSQGQEGLETKLLNQGLTPGSEAYDRALKSFGEERNDAYAQATDRAVLTGSQIGNTAFGNNLQSRQQLVSEALRKRAQPMQELQALAGFAPSSGFNADSSTMQALGMSQNLGMRGYEDSMKRWEDEQGGFLDTLKGVAGVAATVAPLMLSDERAKTDVKRLAVEALAGVPFATFRYRPGLGAPGVHLGVIAQDLQRVAPERVRERPDGYLEVDYSFLAEDRYDG